ncbi:MAG: CvpA family protein [Planctomycetes bacterium]|nr:CvpA family protein [Planctomycetota bacterium]
MNWLDGTILILLGIGAVFGAMSGLLWQIARIVTYTVSTYACMYFHEPAAEFLGAYLPSAAPGVLRVLSYIVVFTGVYLVLFTITVLIEKAMKAVQLKPLDRLGGAGLGAIKAGLLCGTILMGLAIYPNATSEGALAESQVAPVLLEVMRAVIVAVPEEYKEELSAALERMKQAGLQKAGELGADAARRAAENAAGGARAGAAGTGGRQEVGAHGEIIDEFEPPPGSTGSRTAWPQSPARNPTGADATTRRPPAPPEPQPPEDLDNYSDWWWQGQESDARATPR